MRQTGCVYDSVDRLNQIVDPAGGETHFAYNPTAPKRPGNVCTYNSKDRVATRTDPLNQVESFAYDLMDDLTQRVVRAAAGCGSTPAAEIRLPLAIAIWKSIPTTS